MPVSTTYSGQKLINDLSRRLRDPSNVGYSRVALLSILNNCQRAINARLGLVIEPTALALGDTAVYNVASIADGLVVRIVEVIYGDESGGQTLTRVSWSSLVHQAPNWLRLHGPRPEIWATLGRNLLVISPIPFGQANAFIGVSFVKMLPNMVDTATLLANGKAIPDEHMPILLDLAEAVGLYKGREFQNMRAPLDRALHALGLEDAIQTVRREQDNTRK